MSVKLARETRLAHPDTFSNEESVLIMPSLHDDSFRPFCEPECNDLPNCKHNPKCSQYILARGDLPDAYHHPSGSFYNRLAAPETSNCGVRPPANMSHLSRDSCEHECNDLQLGQHHTRCPLHCFAGDECLDSDLSPKRNDA